MDARRRSLRFRLGAERTVGTRLIGTIAARLLLLLRLRLSFATQCACHTAAASSGSTQHASGRSLRLVVAAPYVVHTRCSSGGRLHTSSGLLLRVLSERCADLLLTSGRRGGCRDRVVEHGRDSGAVRGEGRLGLLDDGLRADGRSDVLLLSTTTGALLRLLDRLVRASEDVDGLVTAYQSHAQQRDGKGGHDGE